MTESEFETTNEEVAEPKKRNTVLIAVVAIVLLLLCCCGFLAFAWFFGDAVVEQFGTIFAQPMLLL